MKKIWITSLIKKEETITELSKKLKPFGLMLDGHFWIDDLDNMAWASSIEPLTEKTVILWIILSDSETIKKPSILKGLSLLSIAINYKRENIFSPLIVMEHGQLDKGFLPTMFVNSEIIPLSLPNLGVKAVSLANMPSTLKNTEYRLNVHPLYKLGLWFEVGPGKGKTWNGVIFGVKSSEIKFHAVGKQGFLPEKSTLRYPSVGIEAKIGEESFIACSVQNLLDEETSYFISVTPVPDKIFFCPYTEESESESYVVKLC